MAYAMRSVKPVVHIFAKSLLLFILSNFSLFQPKVAISLQCSAIVIIYCLSVCRLAQRWNRSRFS